MSSKRTLAYRAINRLKRPQEYKQVFSSNLRSAEKQFLFMFSSNGMAHARLGLAIPKKHIKSAVGRNRIKRVIRESFRQRQKQFKGMDVVVLLRKPLTDIEQNRFDVLFDKHWQRINKCKPSSSN